MPTLHALLIAINNYPLPHHRLQGCVADLEAVNDYFGELCRRQGLAFRPRVLTDGEATRERFIEAFDRFADAGDGDRCLFFYSGHGSRMPSPPEFRHIDRDGRCESIVCHDSRLDGGRDLSDKELSYLIWRATHGRDVHFLGLFDCCHAGSVTRNMEFVPRMTGGRDEPVDLVDLIGHEYFLGEGDRREPRTGPHVALAASRAEEPSVEFKVDGRFRGLFTTSLLDAMRRANPATLTYGELLARIQTQVYNLHGNQHPQLDTYGRGGNTLFLDGGLAPEAQHVVRYERDRGWMIDLGSVHRLFPGATAGVAAENNELHRVTVEKVEPGRSILSGMDWAAPGREYYLRGVELRQQTLTLAVHPGLPLSDPLVLGTLQDKLASDPALALLPDPARAPYLLGHDPGRGLVAIRRGELRPVFRAISLDEGIEPAIDLFLRNLRKVGRWEELSALSNPLCRLRPETELEIGLFRVTGHRDYQTLLEREPLNIYEEALLEYENRDGKELNPAIMLHLRKRPEGRRRLYAGALFFSEDFGITDEFLPPRLLTAGEEPHEFAIYNPRSGAYQNIIPFEVTDAIRSWGETEILNRIKIFVSTSPLSLSDLCQEPLQLEPREATRSAGFDRAFRRRAGTEEEDWTTVDINLRIRRS